jgi:hypothetical protein
MPAQRSIEAFAEAGTIAHELGVLPDALDELSVRADLVGAGPIIDAWVRRRIRRQRIRRRWAEKGRP